LISTVKNTYLILLFVLALLLCDQNLFAAETNDTTIADLTNQVAKINAKIQAGKAQETDYADDFKALDALVVKHKGAKPEDLAQILLVKVQMYSDVFLLDDPEKAVEVLKQIKRDYPGAPLNVNIDEAIRGLQETADQQKLWRSLAVGAKFPDFTATNIVGKPLSLADYKGKVVLVEFWATWCPPCQAQLPYLLTAYSKYHGQGFEIIGVSLDDKQQKLMAFIKDSGMPWPQICDGDGWTGKLVKQYGVYLLPSACLLDGQGMIIAKDLRGDALVQAVNDAVAGAKK
jgi:peroxiredoxin